MRIGLVGKPNVGKSTTFAALTETIVEIANYPFTTIDANIGIAWIPLRSTCACSDLAKKMLENGRKIESDMQRNGSICTPRTGSCIGHRRIVPVTLVDVAGLVPDAHQGRGRGNQFLSDLANCDALIQVVDASGTTDIEGNPIGEGACNPEDEFDFLINELDAWISGILNDSWSRGARRAQAEGQSALVGYIHSQLSGLGATESMVTTNLASFISENPDLDVPWTWKEEIVSRLASNLREQLFPVYIAANKADQADPSKWIGLKQRIEEKGGLIEATSAETELGLRRAAKAGAIQYRPGDNDFSITESAELNNVQKKGLEALAKRIENMGGTGLISLISSVVFDRLDRIVAYPVQDESKWIDGDGRILPDALLIPQGSTAKDLAYAVHTDLGDGFIRATDARTGRVIGADHELANDDVVKIHAKA
tara:strand:- start:83 stop:1357 length:1275 start_codon:yes stop_codon:yes gene_type:complete